MLNAFRHHRNSTTNEPVFLAHLLVCSTPFGIIGIPHYVAPKGLLTLAECSTPFGIIGIPLCLPSSSKGREFLCSTPFGIIGIPRRVGRRTQRTTTCAQRLSASSEFHDRSKNVADQLAVCSTPFGIIGIPQSGFRQVRGIFFRVLNAFRHHRNSTYIGTTEPHAMQMCSTPFGIIGIPLRWFQGQCLQWVTSLFSGISSFYFHKRLPGANMLVFIGQLQKNQTLSSDASI